MHDSRVHVKDGMWSTVDIKILYRVTGQMTMHCTAYARPSAFRVMVEVWLCADIVSIVCKFGAIRGVDRGI